ncbi:Aste57867_4996 [Aphanomyces stellatus]|uniref:Aste57867_4996 protein n=1 Tax=Aphanomyces stellatus TaxID=120398 RepID=A0A485KC69_9STRA|nr:hypothetical protein As57867_004983 [Aphanomyces stellatus]VFT82081.1 Aste57867_4996 [Aphanomyces stellatus]
MYASANFFEHFLKLCGETYKATTLSSPWSGARAVSPPPSFRWLVLFVNGFALLKHIACALYLAAQVVIFRNMEPTQRRIAHAFALPTVVVVYMSLAAVHGASSNRRVDPTNRRAFAWLLKWITHKHALAAYNVVQLGCQSYEAIAFATKVVDHTLVAIYVTLVAPHAMVTPWVVYGYHSTPRLLLLNWFSSLSFNLSCIVHIVDFTVNRDPAILTNNVFHVQYIFVTSLIDLAAKIIIQLGSLASTWRLLASVDLADGLYNYGHRLSALALKSTIHLKTRSLRCYMFFSCLWGVVLMVSLCHAPWSSTLPILVCAYVAPLWTTQCQCISACTRMSTAMIYEDINAVLEPRQLGSQLRLLLVSRCDLPNGIDNATFNQFQSLYYIGIKFTNMGTWSGQLPPAIYTIALDNAALTRIPDILLTHMPPTLSGLLLSTYP